MSCDGEESVSVINSTSKRLKHGKLRRYKDQMFGSKWPECYAVLYEDSTFVWYNKETDSSAKGNLRLSRLAPFIVVGGYTDRLPNRPSLPDGCRVQHLVAIGTDSRASKIYWFLCNSDENLNDWMSQIVSTLPPPPAPPPQQTIPQPLNPAPAYNNNNNAPIYAMNRPMVNQPVVYAYQPQPQPPPQTTVIIDRDRGYNNGYGYNSGPGFGTGLLVGGVAGYALGGGFGHHGYGYGGGGYGYGYGGGGGFYEDNDTTVINNYNVTNVNDNDVTNNTYDNTVNNDYDDYGGGGNDDYGGGGDADYGDYGGGDDY